MPQFKKILVFAVISLCFCHEGILLRIDALGQSDVVLDRINPYRQSSFKIGSVNFDLSRNIPIQSSLIDFDFIGALDTSKVTSQFIYDRGDYSFRQTKVIIRNLIDDNKELFIKGHGRQYPGMYNNLGSGYVLQNYLMDYLAGTGNGSFRLTKYSHQEDINLPISAESNSYGRAVESEGTGMYYHKASQMYDFNVEYSNKVFHIDRYASDLENFLNYDTREHLFEFNSIYRIFDNYPMFSDLKYGEYSIQNNLDLVNHSFGECELGTDLITFYYNDDSKDIKSVFSASLKNTYNNSSSDIHPLYKYSLIYTTPNVTWKIQTGSYFQIKNEIVDGNSFQQHEEFFYGYSLQRKAAFFDLNLSLYDVEIMFDEIVDEGSMYELTLKLGGAKAPHGNDKVGFLNNLSLNGVYNHYDYGPVKNRAFFDLYYIYPNPKIAIFEKGNPYMAASISYVSLNPGFGVYLGDNHIIQNTQEGSEPSLKTSTVNISFGLLFETFDISYNFLNLGGDYYSMIGANSDLEINNYQMNYLSIKWRFNDN